MGLEPVLEILLESDTWVRTIGREQESTSPTMQLIRGLRSEQSESHGWNNVILQGLTPSDVILLDPGAVHIRLPQFPDYDITVCAVCDEWCQRSFPSLTPL